jgi:hypothetical protein
LVWSALLVLNAALVGHAQEKTRDNKPQNTLPIIAPGTGLFGSQLPIRLAKAKMTRVLACFDAKTAKLIPEKQRLADNATNGCSRSDSFRGRKTKN